MEAHLDPSRIEVLDDDMVEVLRKKTPVERVAMVLDANRTMRLMLEAHFRERHPEWDAGQISAAVARRLLGEGHSDAIESERASRKNTVMFTTHGTLLADGNLDFQEVQNAEN